MTTQLHHNYLGLILQLRCNLRLHCPPFENIVRARFDPQVRSQRLIKYSSEDEIREIGQRARAK